jgi:hypothetical protein
MTIVKKHKPFDLSQKPNWFDRQLPPEQTIRIDWNNQRNEWWNEACASVLEVFGLPGNRFYYKPCPDYMTFTFKNKKDADLCRILLSERL